jgi:hypothetical protein
MSAPCKKAAGRYWGRGDFGQPIENPPKSPSKKGGLKSPFPGISSQIIIMQFLGGKSLFFITKNQKLKTKN